MVQLVFNWLINTPELAGLPLSLRYVKPITKYQRQWLSRFSHPVQQLTFHEKGERRSAESMTCTGSLLTPNPGSRHRFCDQTVPVPA